MKHPPRSASRNEGGRGGSGLDGPDGLGSGGLEEGNGGSRMGNEGEPQSRQVTTLDWGRGMSLRTAGQSRAAWTVNW